MLSAGIDLPHALTHVPADGGVINLPAIFITLLLSFFLIHGTQESARLDRILICRYTVDVTPKAIYKSD